MKTFTFFRSFALIAALAPGLAFGEVLISPSLGINNHVDKADTTQTSSEHLDVQFYLGYRFPMGFTAGINYYQLSGGGTIKTDSGKLSSSVVYSAPAVSFGFEKSGFMANGHYYLGPTLSSESKTTVTDKSTYSGGSGYGFDIAYYVGFKSFKIGPKLGITHFDYKKSKSTVDGVSTTTDLEGTWNDDWQALYVSFLISL